MTFSKFYEHSSPLFKTLNIIKLLDLVSYQIAIFMYGFKNRVLEGLNRGVTLTVDG